jgi:hypothetical protein
MIWQDAPHQYADIAHRPQPQTVQHAVTELEAIVPTAHLILRIVAVVATVAAVVVGLAGAQDRAGQNLVRLCRTHILKFSHSHQSETSLRLEQRCSLNFVMFSCVMLGVTVKE